MPFGYLARLIVPCPADSLPTEDRRSIGDFLYPALQSVIACRKKLGSRVHVAPHKLAAFKTQFDQVEFVDKDVDYAHRVGIRDVIVEALWKEGTLA
jgi:hypothetical protein